MWLEAGVADGDVGFVGGPSGGEDGGFGVEGVDGVGVETGEEVVEDLEERDVYFLAEGGVVVLQDVQNRMHDLLLDTY